jgi:hypothetical protein
LTSWPWPRSLTYFLKTLTLMAVYSKYIGPSYLTDVHFIWSDGSILKPDQNVWCFYVWVKILCFTCTCWPNVLCGKKNFCIDCVGLIFLMGSCRDFICVFFVTRPIYWYLIFDLLTLTMNIKNFIFWMGSCWDFIFHMCIPYDETFLLVP